MTKKIFTAVLLLITVVFAGCSDDSAGDDTSANTAQASPVAKNIPSFSAKTIEGKPITNEIFAAKKITVLNIWGTFCPPCIAEMPDLGKMARTIPEDAQIIGLICDATEDSPQQIKKALQITQEAGADFVNIVPDEQLLRFMEGVEAVPTTIFINNKGEVVGKAIIGADVDGYKDELKRLLAQ